MSEEAHNFPMMIEEGELLHEALYQFANTFYIGMGKRPGFGKEQMMKNLLDALDDWIEQRKIEREYDE